MFFQIVTFIIMVIMVIYIVKNEQVRPIDREWWPLLPLTVGTILSLLTNKFYIPGEGAGSFISITFVIVGTLLFF